MMRHELNRGRSSLLLTGLLVWVVACTLAGCARGPVVYKSRDQVTLDRRFVDYPSGFDLKLAASNFTAPVAIAFDGDTRLIAEGGFEGEEPRIWAIKPDDSLQLIYPFSRRIPFSPVQPGFQIYGPIGGMVVDHHKIYVSHRDREGRGEITQFGFDGSHHTIVSGLPAEGDYGVTDLAVYNGRLYYGVGAATNSGVVGLDNLHWLRQHRNFCDQPAVDLELLGLRFSTKNPFASFFSSLGETGNTGPLQPFGVSDRTMIAHSPLNKPNCCVMSVAIAGGDPVVEAYGIRYPRGLAFQTEFAGLFVSNDGMELRGSRPVKDDPDVIIRVYYGGPPTWYGFPDYSADMQLLNKPQFQPPLNAFPPNNVPKVGPVIDHEASNLREPSPETLLKAKLPPLSGAAKMAFAPVAGPLGKRFRNDLFVCLAGDHGPFATSGYPLKRPVGYKVVRVNVDNGKVDDFVFNVDQLPASLIDRRGYTGLERPVDVKVGPDGSLYLLDMGEVEYRTDGRQKVSRGTGKLFRLVPSPATITATPATEPTAPTVP